MGKEKLKVYMRFRDSKVSCICLISNPVCDRYKTCKEDMVTHDKYEGFKQCFNQDRYGK